MAKLSFQLPMHIRIVNAIDFVLSINDVQCRRHCPNCDYINQAIHALQSVVVFTSSGNAPIINDKWLCECAILLNWINHREQEVNQALFGKGSQAKQFEILRLIHKAFYGLPITESSIAKLYLKYFPVAKSIPGLKVQEDFERLCRGYLDKEPGTTISKAKEYYLSQSRIFCNAGLSFLGSYLPLHDFIIHGSEIATTIINAFDTVLAHCNEASDQVESCLQNVLHNGTQWVTELAANIEANGNVNKDIDFFNKVFRSTNGKLGGSFEHISFDEPFLDRGVMANLMREVCAPTKKKEALIINPSLDKMND